jgi:histidinol-phosphate aminotransferase
MTQADAAGPSWITAAVRALPPYKGPTQLADFPSGSRIHALHLNECPYPPSPRVVATIAAAAGQINRYPDIPARALAAALAARTGVPPSCIVFGTGSDELIHLICEVALRGGDRVVVPAPTFPRYAMSGRILGAEVKRVRIDAAGANDAAGLVAAIDGRTRVVFCCTPNPPSGGMMDAAALDRLARGTPDDVLLAVDEAYYEFGRHAGGPDAAEVLRSRRGAWVVLRTFSKAYGLAALRVGYALCGSEEVAGALRKIKLQYNVTSLGQVAALAALSDEAHLRTTLDNTARERQRLADGMTRLGLKPLPSAANFVSAEVPMAASTCMTELQKRRVLIRDWRDPDYPNHIRVTVGLPDDTDAVVAALGGVLAAQAAPLQARA